MANLTLHDLAGLRPIPTRHVCGLRCGWGSGRIGIWTVTDVPVTVYEPRVAVGWPAGPRPTGADDDVTAHCRRCALRPRDLRGRVHRSDVSQRLGAQTDWPTAAESRGSSSAVAATRYASTALMDPMSKAFVTGIHDFIATRGLELVGFAKGQRKDELTQQFLAGFPAAEGVLYVGRAQEKSGVWRTQRRHNPATGGSYAWLVRATAFINFFYFYCVDADFGPFFIKFSTYFPFTAKICINGNEWAKRQAAKAGIGFEALDNGFAAVDDVDRLQAICDSLGPGHIEALLRKWLKILPNPFTTADEAAGYRYELSVLQAEFSLTQMPVSYTHLQAHET